MLLVALAVFFEVLGPSDVKLESLPRQYTIKTMAFVCLNGLR